MNDDGLRGIGGDAPPPAGQEARIVARLRAEGLLRPARAPRLAAAVALFAAGLAAGWWLSRPRGASAPAGPRYVLLLEGGDGVADEGARVAGVIAWARAQRAAGTSLSGEKLADGGEIVSAAGATPVAPHGLGGYFVVHARDDAEARRIAASHPIIGWGGRVVVRRIEEM